MKKSCLFCGSWKKTKYILATKDGKPELLGSGSYAHVYGAQKRSGRGQFALKVIGFGEKGADSSDFQKTLEKQQTMSLSCPYIVKVHDFTQLRVWLDPQGQVVDLAPYPFPNRPGNALDLQFVLMERLEPVLCSARFGKVQLHPARLAGGDEQEIITLAGHITQALETAHKGKMLHRDVKLENIFYDSRRKRYKLGDFGIAKITKDGFASTTAFTKGYGAPEIVLSPVERYDQTADIYSLGMSLYLLLNELRFPDAQGYHVNAQMQYCPGYILPKPCHGSGDLCALVNRMCRYSPDDRPQTMAAVRRELSSCGFDALMHYRANFTKTYLALGCLLLLSGGASVQFLPEQMWLSFLLLSLGCLFFAQSLITKLGYSPKVMNLYNHFIFLMGTVCYGLMLLTGLAYSVNPQSFWYENLGLEELGALVTYVMETYRIGHIGAVGFAVCLFWLLRESYFRRKYSGEV